MTEADFDLDMFLAERHRPASVATVTASNSPALATMWYLSKERRFWFHCPSASRAFLEAASKGESVAVMVASWDPPHDIRQLRVPGAARIEPHDTGRVAEIYSRYLDGSRAT